MPHQCYHWFEVPAPMNNSWVLAHCLGDEDATCWCEPEVMVLCPHCDAEPDEEPPELEGWEQPCPFCGSFGLMNIQDVYSDLDPDEPLLIIHHDR